MQTNNPKSVQCKEAVKLTGKKKKVDHISKTHNAAEEQKQKEEFMQPKKENQTNKYLESRSRSPKLEYMNKAERSFT